MLQQAVPSAPRFRPLSILADAPGPSLSTTPSHAPSTSRPSPPLTMPQSVVYRTASSESLISYNSQQNHQLPALSTLASLAASVPAAVTSGGDSTRSSTPSNSMNLPQYAPAATAGGQQNGPPVCHNCGTSTTPLWRRDESGAVLCNACGLFLKLHSRPRPISLKTDVIKSRNRVKTAQPRKYDGGDAPTLQPLPQPANGYPAAHPDVSNQAMRTHHPPPHPLHGHHFSNGDAAPRLPSPPSISRSGTPGLHSHHNPNIAPQHVFDTVSLPGDARASPSLPAFAFRQPSPSALSANGANASHPDAPLSYDALHAHNSHLRTRVSELEVINDLFRGRVSELEQAEQEARRAERLKDEEVERAKNDLETANKKVADLTKLVAEMEEVKKAQSDLETANKTVADLMKRVAEMEAARPDTPRKRARRGSVRDGADGRDGKMERE